MNVYIRPERPRDDGVMGPELGPFDAVQITYDMLRRCPDGEEIMGRAKDGDWYFTPAFGDPEVPYSDIVIYSRGEVEKPSYNGPAYLPEALYTHMHGILCPVCGSDQIEGSETDIDAGGATQECSCNVCESTWYDAYDLNGYCNLQAALLPDTLVRVTARYDWPNQTIGEQRWITRQEWAIEERVLQYLSDILSKPVTLTDWWADPL